MAAIFKTPASRKWVVLGIKAAITALALLPQLRERQQNTGCLRSESDFPNAMSASPLGLLLLDERGYVITSYQIRHHISDDSAVDSDGIKRAASKAKAYGAVLTFDKGVYANGLSIEPDVVESVRTALEEVGVRLFNQSFSSRTGP